MGRHAHRDLRHPTDLELGLRADSIRSIASNAIADELSMGWAVIAAKRPNGKRRSVIARAIYDIWDIWQHITILRESSEVQE
jgi:hypothetical protein